MTTWITEHWRLLLPLALGWVCVWLLMPRGPHRSRALAGIFGLAGLLAVKFYWLPPSGPLLQEIFFLTFAAMAIIGGVLMITDHNPVYAALWFAIVTLAVCGLFLLNSAPFLSAATVIVYAGAIIVTFLFVIALAQQSGSAMYDRRASHPTLATLSGFLLLGCLMFTLQEWGGQAAAEGGNAFLKVPAGTTANLGSVATEDLGSLRSVGRSLFTDYVYAVEIAGTVLLIATIGAICMAPRRSQGNL